MNRASFAFLIGLSACVAVNAQDFRVQYVDGLVEVQRGAAWYQVATGDTIPAGAVVRLDDGSFAELAGATGAALRLTRRGTYDLGRLAVANTQSQSVGVAAFLTQRARAMSAAEDSIPQRGVTTAGVRGAAADQSQLKWAGAESPDELMAAGIRKLSSGEYKEAYALFEDARESSTGPDEARAVFYLGYSSYLRGDFVSALRYLQNPRPDPVSRHYHDHVLVFAQLLVETFAYADSAELLQGYLKSGAPTGDNLQSAQLFLGLSQKGLGNRERAAESLRAAQQANPGSAVGRAAAKILETL